MVPRFQKTRDTPLGIGGKNNRPGAVLANEISLFF
jgi:hypothetical protein